VTAVVDASVAIKWVFEEEGSGAARRLVLDELLVAPDLLFVECANVLRCKVRERALPPEQARQALLTIDATPIRTATTRRHASAAYAIAVEIGSSAYDALYLAVALAERAQMVTADVRFARLAMAHPIYADWVRPLG